MIQFLSLDENNEEFFAKRLSKIQPKRQVVVFTHRISLMWMLKFYAKKEELKCKFIYVSKEPWGAGETGNIPFFAKKTKQALNDIINDDFQKAKKAYTKNGTVDYNDKASLICKNFRILLERMIEHDLLSGVIQRNDRKVTTEDNIHKLAHISQKDCKLFDSLMTKYSIYLHSQPIKSSPSPPPEPNELENDLKKLKNWQKEFSERKKNHAIPKETA